jgi:hypothetical protein
MTSVSQIAMTLQSTANSPVAPRRSSSSASSEQASGTQITTFHAIMKCDVDVPSKLAASGAAAQDSQSERMRQADDRAQEALLREPQGRQSSLAASWSSGSLRSCISQSRFARMSGQPAGAASRTPPPNPSET